MREVRTLTALATAATVLLLAGCGGTKQLPEPGAALEAAADTRAARAVEAADPTAKCTARTWAVRPPGAPGLDQVKVIYAWVTCDYAAVAGTRSSASIPTAVTLGTPDKVEQPADSDILADEKRIFPPDVIKGAGS